MATQSRLGVFCDENHILGGFSMAEIRNKRPTYNVLCEVGANQMNSLNTIPGFYDRKPLYARGPSKALKNRQENCDDGQFDFTLDKPMCDMRPSEPMFVSRGAWQQPLPNIEFPIPVLPPAERKFDVVIRKPTSFGDGERLLDDKFFTGLYGDTHYAHLRELEVKLRPRFDYMRRQKDISADMRSVLIDWLVEVNEEYKHSDETLFLTVSLIDRFLSMMSVVRGKLQLVGTAAILVAAKVEEIYPPQLADLVYITDDTYTSSQILRMEALLLKNLDFSVSNAHTLTFVQSFVIKAKLSRRVAFMAQYICELTLLDCDALVFRASETAAAAVLLALHHIEGNIDSWTEETHRFSRLDSTQLQSIVNFLQTVLLEASSSSHKAIRNKYAQRKYSSVSLHPIRPTAPHVLTL